MNSVVADLAIIVALFTTLIIGLESGFQLGKRAIVGQKDPLTWLLATVQGATLGLLGLLLGFSFSGAAGRYMERQDLIVNEANAIRKAYLNADILDEPYRSDLKNVLVRYADSPLMLQENFRKTLPEDAKAQIRAFHDAIWKAASTGVSAKPTAITMVLGSVSDVFTVYTARMAAARKRLPPIVLCLLVVSAWLSLLEIGYGFGLQGRRRMHWITGSLILLVGATLWTTIDLDHPRDGLVQVSDAPRLELNLTTADSGATMQK